MNVMSYNRDLDIRGLMDESKPLLEYNDLWAIGAHGPCGCYLPPKGVERLEDFHELQPDWLPCMFADYNSLVLQQKDGYNCGIFSCLFMLDFMKTQWRKPYAYGSFSDGARSEDKLYQLPPTYKLGSTFATVQGLTGHAEDICQLVRLELCI
jgi:hypothetical protein